VTTTLFDLVAGSAAAQLSYGDYAPIRFSYRAEIAGIVNEYINTEGARITRFRNQFKRAIVEAFYPAFEQGLKDGGYAGKYAQGEDLEWINARVEGEWGFVDDLFQQLRDLKREEGVPLDEPERRAENYARTLDGIYSMGKVRGAQNRMLTFRGLDGQENCPTCARLKGQRHRAAWWKNKGLVLYRGNANYECGCWQCQHFLVDDRGEIFTI
jgi:hypothetical protein